MFTKKFLLLTILFISIQISILPLKLSAQTFQDIFTKGVPVKSGSVIYLRFRNTLGKNELMYSFHKKSDNYKTLDTANYFLIRDNSVIVYLEPTNPINFNTASEIYTSIDKIDSNFNTGLSEMIKTLQVLQTTPGNSQLKGRENIFDTSCSANISVIIGKLKELEEQISINKSDSISLVFNQLQKLDFINPTQVKETLNITSKAIGNLNKHFELQKKTKSEAEKLIAEFTCKTAEQAISGGILAAEIQALVKNLPPKKMTPAHKNLVSELTLKASEAETIAEISSDEQFRLFTIKNLAGLVVNNLEIERTKREALFNNLIKIHGLIQEAYTKGIGSNNDTWSNRLNQVDLTKGKISHLKLTINDKGYTISDGVISEKEATVNHIYNIKFRKYQSFIPEVSGGFAYTNIDYFKYGVNFDEGLNQNVVANAGVENIRRINISTMLNFYHYKFSNEYFFPFFQIGVGTNLESPVLFLGSGLNIFAGNFSNLSVSGGYAGLFRKELNSLEVGSQVKGTAELEEDLSFQPTSGWYLSLQWKIK